MKKTVVYPAIIEGDPVSGFSAYFPDIGGCTTGGDNEKTLAINAAEALTAHLELLLESGEMLPVASRLQDAESLSPETEIGRTLVVAELELGAEQTAA